MKDRENEINGCSKNYTVGGVEILTVCIYVQL